MRAAILILLLAATPARADNVVASYYGFESGKRTANGERFHPLGMTCAHRTLRFGTRLRVTYRDRSIVCRVNDRGPYIAGRGLDLSLGAARRLGMTGQGVARVGVEVVRP